jgi:hypothetical protein
MQRRRRRRRRRMEATATLGTSYCFSQCGP